MGIGGEPTKAARLGGWARPVAVAGAAALALLASARVGPASRRFAAGVTVVRCQSPADFLDVWTGAGVRGRTLVHLVRRIAMDGEGTREDGYLNRAVLAGRVRRVFHVISEGSWSEVSAKLGDLPTARYDGRAFHLRVEGMSVIVLRLADLPRIDEPVLVTADLDAYPPADVAALAARLVRGDPRADIVTWVGAHPSPQLDALDDRSR